MNDKKVLLNGLKMPKKFIYTEIIFSFNSIIHN